MDAISLSPRPSGLSALPITASADNSRSASGQKFRKFCLKLPVGNSDITLIFKPRFGLACGGWTRPTKCAVLTIFCHRTRMVGHEAMALIGGSGGPGLGQHGLLSESI